MRDRSVKFDSLPCTRGEESAAKSSAIRVVWGATLGKRSIDACRRTRSGLTESQAFETVNLAAMSPFGFCVCGDVNAIFVFVLNLDVFCLASASWLRRGPEHPLFDSASPTDPNSPRVTACDTNFELPHRLRAIPP